MTEVLDRRRAGVLLHLSSLDAALGRGGRAFIDWLVSAGFSVWQFLPLGPTGAGGSPYWVRSDSAGNPAFIDSEEAGSVDPAELGSFMTRAPWLDDYATYRVLSDLHSDAPWWRWPAPHRDRDPQSLAGIRAELHESLQRVREEQFRFERQWNALRSYARERGVQLFGDLPLYVAPDSAETWAHREQFQLHEDGSARCVAGVPPDYFSEKGQLWGNPLYDWTRMRRDGFAFWRARLRRQLERVDLLRIDHFRALAAHWAVRADAPDARSGAWHKSPGRALLRTLRADHPRLPLIAEDLGLITPDVDALRRAFQLPGMRVLQFAFDGSSANPHLPYMHEPDCVAYTGTHDNDTTVGWYHSLDAHTAGRVNYMLNSQAPMPEALIRATLGSVAKLAIIPAQDLLGLGSEARLNTPGTTHGNWSWKLPHGALGAELAQRMHALNAVYGRV